jgi:MFS family permease
MRLSPLDLQWVMNAELLPLAALTLVAGALGDRFGQKRIFLAGIALFGLALQLPICYKVRALSCGLVSSAPE